MTRIRLSSHRSRIYLVLMDKEVEARTRKLKWRGHQTANVWTANFLIAAAMEETFLVSAGIS